MHPKSVLARWMSLIAARSVFSGLAIAVTLPSQAGGPLTDFTWDQPAGGVFGFAPNWNPFVIFPPPGQPAVVGPPGPGEMATFDLGNAAYTVTFGASHTNTRCRIGDDAVTFSMGGQTYTLTSTGSPSIALGYGLGAGDSPSLTLTNGLVVAQDADIAAVGGMTGAQMVVGSGAALNLAGWLSVGALDAGTLTVMSAGDVSCENGILGEAFISVPIPSTGNGTATITGAGSTWTLVNSLIVAGVGDGTLNINSGGRVMPSCIACVDVLSMTIGSGANADGVLNITGPGSDLTITGSMIAGAAGTANITVSGGGTLHTNANPLPNGEFGDKIGLGTGSVGSVTLTGPGSSWFSDESVIIGGDPIVPLTGGQGSGHLSILNGANATHGFGLHGATIARSVGSSGTVVVSGAGSFWDIGLTLTVGSLGSADMTINSGADVAADQVFIAAGAQASGDLTIDGAGSTLTTPVAFVVGGGIASIGGPALLTISNGAHVTHQNAGSNFIVRPPGTVDLAGGSLTAPAISHSGLIKGDGAITADLTSNGVIAPGHSAGTLTINGDFTQQSLGTLEVELGGLDAGTEHDQLVVSGDVTLAGVLDVSIINGLFPAPGDAFTVIHSTGGAVSGAFDSLISPLAFDVVYLSDRVLVRVPVDCPADISGNDGIVNIDDLLAVISAWGACPAPPAACPANIVNSGASANVVNIDDLLAVISAWGACP